MGSPEKKYPYEGERVNKCRYCDMDIFFKKLPNGKWMPVTKLTLKGHWADCPGAQKARSTKNRGKTRD